MINNIYIREKILLTEKRRTIVGFSSHIVMQSAEVDHETHKNGLQETLATFIARSSLQS
jgi:hypothetical protein